MPEGPKIAQATELEAVPAPEEEDAIESTELYPGSDQFINRNVASKPRTFEIQEGEILLNFENTSIREVVKTILGDILEENYVIDKAVQGTVTVQTGRPLPKSALISTLETLLRMNNAALVRAEGLYKVVPINQAVQGHLSPRLKRAGAAAGYGVRIVPLRYIGATEMQKILEPFVPQGTILRIDPARNLLILAGTAQELAQWQETIDIFDVNWLEGMSVGLYKLEYADAELVVNELNAVLGPEAATPLAGMFRFIPIERLNAVLAITSQSKYLEEAQTWIERLDRGEDAEAGRLYVYSVQNGSAEHLAGLLQEAFGQGGGRGITPAARVAPGREATELFAPRTGGFGSSRRGGFGSSRTGGFGSSRTGGFGSSPMGGFKASQALDPSASQEPDLRAFQAEAGGEAENGDKKPRRPGPAGIEFERAGAEDAAAELEVRIVADVQNNALLIFATPRIYEKILAALRQLDIPPRQVLVEATIAEVQLTDNLQYGLQWFFRNEVGEIGGNKFSGSGSINLLDGFSGLQAAEAGGGFTYALTEGGMVRALLRTLASDSKLKILSSPQLLALDNQTAAIQVGDQVPIQLGSTIGIGGAQTTQIQFKDTGVLLTVTPRINAGGRVTLELRQEVTDVKTISGGLQGNPTFFQRAFESVVTVQSGETIVLGGLIQDSDNFTETGVPFLYKLPVIGSLFGSTTRDRRRTELIVLMTPRVVSNQHEARLVTEEFRWKLRNASDIVEEMGGIVPKKVNEEEKSSATDEQHSEP
ncbi:type II secretion system secretin GspD [Nitrosococcus wardiae]|uniref:type II secretion system secretin GspD n=1 Tax=Nitrosococcus wardiae TaxID=1814290 RepID=UPI001F0DBB58|nr:type II secretion system secretin GspD [Nitrosococcus wardiae]